MARLNARVWAMWVAAASLPALFSRNPAYLILALLAVAVVRASLAEADRRASLPMWRLGLMLIVIATAWNALTVHAGDTILFRLPAGLPFVGGIVTLEAAIFGATSGLAVWLLMAAFNTFSLALTPYQMLSLAPRALRHAGLVVSIALTFFPQTLRTAREVREAQAVRGHRPRHWRDATAMVVPLLLNSLESAAQIAEAMEARGYGRAAHPRSGLGWMGLIVGCLVLLYWGSIAGWIIVALSVGWLIVTSRGIAITRYKRDQWTALDSLVALTVAGVGGALILVALNDPSALVYYPYPRAALPSLDLPLVAALSLLAAPAARGFVFRPSSPAVRSSL
jgi:energy-coupling factor transport system permease protein